MSDTKPPATPEDSFPKLEEPTPNDLAVRKIAHKIVQCLGGSYSPSRIVVHSTDCDRATKHIAAALAQQTYERDEARARVDKIEPELQTAETKLAEAHAVNLQMAKVLEDALPFLEIFARTVDFEVAPLIKARAALSSDGVAPYRNLLDVVARFAVFKATSNEIEDAWAAIQSGAPASKEGEKGAARASFLMVGAVASGTHRLDHS